MEDAANSCDLAKNTLLGLLALFQSIKQAVQLGCGWLVIKIKNCIPTQVDFHDSNYLFCSTVMSGIIENTLLHSKSSILI